MKQYTDEYTGSLLREAVDYVLPALVATYTVGYIFGQLVHRLNDRLAAVFL